MTAPTDLPPVTDAHRRAAFEALALRGFRWATYSAALANDTARKVIECRAAVMRTEEYKATHQRSVVRVTRCTPGLDGHPLKWCTQMAPGPWQPITQPDLLG